MTNVTINTLTEMPKVGDELRYVGVAYRFMTVGKEYEVVGLFPNSFRYKDDEGQELSAGYVSFHEWQLVTQPQPDVPELLANLGRRLHEVEQYLADEEAEQYPDDDVVTELTLEPGVRDAVNHPNHYTTGAVEVIDYIDQVADGYDGKQAAYVANVIKYVSRAPYKNQSQDIRKAIWYAERLADAMECEEAEASE